MGEKDDIHAGADGFPASVSDDNTVYRKTAEKIQDNLATVMLPECRQANWIVEQLSQLFREPKARRPQTIGTIVLQSDNLRRRCLIPSSTAHFWMPDEVAHGLPAFVSR